MGLANFPVHGVIDVHVPGEELVGERHVWGCFVAVIVCVLSGLVM